MVKLTNIHYLRLQEFLKNNKLPNVTEREANERVNEALKLMNKVGPYQKPWNVLNGEELQRAKWALYYNSITDETIYKNHLSYEIDEEE